MQAGAEQRIEDSTVRSVSCDNSIGWNILSGRGSAELAKPNLPAGLKFSSALVRSPVHLELAVMDRTITKVQIDQALVRNTRLFRHSFKIGHSVPV